MKNNKETLCLRIPGDRRKSLDLAEDIITSCSFFQSSSLTLGLGFLDVSKKKRSLLFEAEDAMVIPVTPIRFSVCCKISRGL